MEQVIEVEHLEEVLEDDIKVVIIIFLILDRDNNSKDQTQISIDCMLDKVHNSGVTGPCTVMRTEEDRIVSMHKLRA